MNSMRGNVDERFDALLGAYRDACPTPEPSANFHAQSLAADRIAPKFHILIPAHGNAFVTAAVALSIALGVYMSIPRSNSTLLFASYLEALADANTLDTPGLR